MFGGRPSAHSQLNNTSTYKQLPFKWAKHEARRHHIHFTHPIGLLIKRIHPIICHQSFILKLWRKDVAIHFIVSEDIVIAGLTNLNSHANGHSYRTFLL